MIKRTDTNIRVEGSRRMELDNTIDNCALNPLLPFVPWKQLNSRTILFVSSIDEPCIVEDSRAPRLNRLGPSKIPQNCEKDKKLNRE
jgi:hypothetical protein